MLQNQTVTHTSPQNSSLQLHRQCLDTHRRVHCYKDFKNKLFWANKKEETFKNKKEQLFQVNSLTLDNSSSAADYTAPLICNWHLCALNKMNKVICWRHNMFNLKYHYEPDVLNYERAGEGKALTTHHYDLFCSTIRIQNTIYYSVATCTAQICLVQQSPWGLHARTDCRRT